MNISSDGYWNSIRRTYSRTTSKHWSLSSLLSHPLGIWLICLKSCPIFPLFCENWDRHVSCVHRYTGLGKYFDQEQSFSDLGCVGLQRYRSIPFVEIIIEPNWLHEIIFQLWDNKRTNESKFSTISVLLLLILTISANVATESSGSNPWQFKVTYLHSHNFRIFLKISVNAYL